jgi:hypothetical protein
MGLAPHAKPNFVCERTREQIVLKATLEQIPGVCGYYYQKTFCNRGHPSVIVIVLLGFNTAAAAEAALKKLRSIAGMFCNMAVVVTASDRSFWKMRAAIRPDSAGLVHNRKYVNYIHKYIHKHAM